MNVRRPIAMATLAVILLATVAPAPAAAQGRTDSQMAWAVHVSLAPNWFDPGEHTGIITVMMVLYAVHDAMVKITGILYSGAGGHGNAATRIQNYYVTDGLYAFGGYPDMDDLFVQQARELDAKRRKALLHQIQRLARRTGHARAAVGAGLPERRGPARRGVGARSHRAVPVFVPVRGPELKK